MATQEDRKDTTPREDSNAYEGDGPGKIGLISDQQPDLMAPRMTSPWAAAR
jgi:hypothetical protein